MAIRSNFTVMGNWKRPILFHVKKQKMPKHRKLLQPEADIFSKSGTHRKMEKVLLINQETL